MVGKTHIKNHGAVKDSSHRRQLCRNLRNHSVNVLAVGNVTALQCDSGAQIFGVFDNLGNLVRDLVGSRNDDDILGASPRHPLGDAAANATCSANDDVSRIALEDAIECLRGVGCLGSVSSRFPTLSVIRANTNLDQVFRASRDQNLAVSLAGLKCSESCFNVRN
jgi:hypothetical protein